MVLRYYPIGVLYQVLYMCMYLTTCYHTEDVRECISLSCNNVVDNVVAPPSSPLPRNVCRSVSYLVLGVLSLFSIALRKFPKLSLSKKCP